MAVTGVQVNRRNKDTHDLGIRRWLADAGCGYDLVQTSMVEELGGQSLIRLREPKYLQTANGVTSLHHDITMRIPQLDEFAEILRMKNTPSVISIGKRCGDGILFPLAFILRKSILCQARWNTCELFGREQYTIPRGRIRRKRLPRGRGTIAGRGSTTW
jgi:hypothetical protein